MTKGHASDGSGSSTLESSSSREIVQHVASCSGEACDKTVIKHGDHIGHVVDGKLLCITHHGEVEEHELAFEKYPVCMPVKETDCWHDGDCDCVRVKHGDHFDYIVRGRLQHVNPENECDFCSDDTCKAKGVLVDHGPVAVLRAGKSDVCGISETSITQPLIGRGQHGAGSAHEDEDGHDDDAAVVTTEVLCRGICCPSEEPIAYRALRRIPGITSVNVSVVAQLVTVQHRASTQPGTIVSALNSVGLQATLKGDAGDGKGGGSWPPWNLALSVPLLAVAYFGYIPSASYLKWVALAPVVLAGTPIFRRALISVYKLSLDINVLMSVAVVGAVVLGEYLEAGAVVVLFGMAQWLENKALGGARQALEQVLTLAPESAVLTSGEAVAPEHVRVGDVVLLLPGSKAPVDGVVVSASWSNMDESMLTGESRPVRKVAGDAVSAGTLNLGPGALEVEASAVAHDSAVARLARLVQEAQAQKSKQELMVERFARWYTPVVFLGCAALAGIGAGLNPHVWDEWVYKALVVLVTACPCALVISTPVTNVCALTQAAREGLLIKGGEFLERLHHLGTVSFDKTGTLTEGIFKVNRFHPQCALAQRSLSVCAVAVGDPGGAARCGDGGAVGEQAWDQLLHTPGSPGGVGEAGAEDAGAGAAYNDLKRLHSQHGGGAEATGALLGLLEIVASLEAKSQHPLGPAIVAYARGRGVDALDDVEHFAVVEGRGVRGVVNGVRVAVGNEAMAADLLTPASAGALVGSRELARAWEQRGMAVVWVVVEGALHGMIGVSDAVRPGAAAAVTALKQRRGLRVAMVTGDARAVADRVGAIVGIPPADVHAELLPAGKVTTVARLRKGTKGQLAHVGDGVNDAPALAAADLGIALGAMASAVAMETADVAVLSNDLTMVPRAIEIGSGAVWRIRANLTFSIAVKAVTLVLALLGMLQLWAAVLADVGASLLVVLNGMSILRVSKRKGAAPEDGAACRKLCCGEGAAIADLEEGRPCCAPAAGGCSSAAPSGGCCAPRSCGTGQDACGAPAKKPCCASKQCGSSSAPVAEQKKPCCASKQCGSGSAPVAEQKKPCCASKQCGSAPVQKPTCCGSGGKCGDAAARPEDVRPTVDCCADEGTCGAAKPPCGAGASACGGKQAAKPAGGCCGSKQSGGSAPTTESKPACCSKGQCGSEKTPEPKPSCSSGKPACSGAATQKPEGGCCGSKKSAAAETSSSTPTGTCDEATPQHDAAQGGCCSKGACGEKKA
ncbi:unnamed protein product [Pedinophyceae sp. YPF-701]|nr:unnamed protein product [Pedinophyceae sp. YPF-701]